MVIVHAGRYQDAIEACVECRASLSEQACPGLAATLLSQQARSYLARGQYSASLDCVQQALVLLPGHVPSLLLRAQVGSQ